MKDVERIAQIVDAAKPLLAGRPSEVQGGALAELVSIWLAGFHPKMRDEMLALWLKMALAMVPLCEEEIFFNRDRPEGWDA